MWSQERLNEASIIYAILPGSPLLMTFVNLVSFLHDLMYSIENLLVLYLL